MQQEIKVQDPRTEAILTAYHQVIVERLESGLAAIQQQAMEAMREIALEVWRTSGAQSGELQSQILTAMSKDDAMRGLMQHSDERFQSLSVRVGHIEDSLTAVSNATRELRTLLISGNLGGGSADPAALEQVDALGARIDQIEQHLAAAFEHLSSRDQAFLSTVETRMEAVAAEAAGGADPEKAREMQEQLRTTTAAMGVLVRTVQAEVAQLKEMATREIAIDPAEILRRLEAIGSASADTEAMGATFDDRVGRLAQLVRSDSQRIAKLIQEQADAQGRVVAETLDSRLGRMSEIVSATTMSAVNEVARTVPEQAAEALQDKIDEVVTKIDENFVDLVDVTETELHRMGRLIAETTAERVTSTMNEQFEGAMGRLAGAVEAAEAIPHPTAPSAPFDAETGAPAETSVVVGATTEEISGMLDARITGLAKMIRSDNRAMAEVIQVAAEQQAAKHAARLVTELAASLPQQILETLDRRFAGFEEALHADTQETVVAVAKAADVLSTRIDRAAVAVAQQYDRDMQGINQSLTEAVQALVSLPRAR